MTELADNSQLRWSLLRWVLVTVPGVLLLGILSGAVAGSGPDNAWFAALTKPAIYPPPAAFGIVWTVLYVLIGLALAIVASARGARLRTAAIVAFLFQFVLNLAWSPLFFAAHQLTGALALLVVLDLAVIVTLVLFWRVRPVAALLLVPYLAWILFATVLNWEFRAAHPQADERPASGAVSRVEF
ncbi:MAG: tryptophan-rich sensory protein [Novosphingobium sp.]|nr:tryptophan-rich sensory protein [Novosphingobium sp.]